MGFGDILNKASFGTLGEVFGTRPGALAPPTMFQEAQKFDPAAQSQTDAASRYVTNMESGLLPPDVMRSIKNAGATWGVSSGMPGSGMATDVSLESLGLNSLEAEQQGFNDYMKFLGFGASMEDPSTTQTQIALQNSMFKNAPDPIMGGMTNMIMGTGGSIAGAYLGAGGGGGGGTGGGGGGGL